MSVIDDGPHDHESDADSGPEHVSAGVGGGILGNLPNTRPSIRSPRRNQGAADPAEVPHGDASHKTENSAPKSPPSAEPPSRPGVGEPPPSDSEHSEIEALARGGVAVAEALATTGLRLAGRAAAKIRDVIEPR